MAGSKCSDKWNFFDGRVEREYFNERRAGGLFQLAGPFNRPPITIQLLPSNYQSRLKVLVTRRDDYSPETATFLLAASSHTGQPNKKEKTANAAPPITDADLNRSVIKKKKKRTKWKWARKCVGHHQATHTRGATKVEIVADKNCTNARCSVSRHGSTLCTEQVTQILTPTD